MTDDDVEQYVEHLHAHLPPEYSYLSTEQVRAVLDAEAAYFERRFGAIRGWRALLRAMFGRGEPPPSRVEELLPEFEEYAVGTLAARGDLSREEIRAVMRVEGEDGPLWAPPALPPRQDDDTPRQNDDMPSGSGNR